VALVFIDAGDAFEWEDYELAWGLLSGHGPGRRRRPGTPTRPSCPTPVGDPTRPPGPAWRSPSPSGRASSPRPGAPTEAGHRCTWDSWSATATCSPTPRAKSSTRPPPRTSTRRPKPSQGIASLSSLQRATAPSGTPWAGPFAGRIQARAGRAVSLLRSDPLHDSDDRGLRSVGLLLTNFALGRLLWVALGRPRRTAHPLLSSAAPCRPA
jgi:hypothetical protein